MLGRTALISRGFSCQHLSKNVTFYMNELPPPGAGRQSQAEDHKPLTLMLPWLGSRPQAVDKYCELYLRSGFDVLVVKSEVQEFLWPRLGLDHGRGLLELLHTQRFESRPLLVHAFSIGGYTFSQLLVNVSQDPERYQDFIKRIRGQVYDSLVVGSLETMATGVGKTVFPRWETLIKQASLLYFGVFRRQTVDYYDKGIDAFRNSPVCAPALFFFCGDDTMSDCGALEELMEHWQRRGVHVTAKRWEKSTHAGHLKRHPQEYETTLDTFVQSLRISPLKAKM